MRRFLRIKILGKTPHIRVERGLAASGKAKYISEVTYVHIILKIITNYLEALKRSMIRGRYLIRRFVHDEDNSKND